MVWACRSFVRSAGIIQRAFFKIELTPLRLPQFTGARIEKCHQLQGASGDDLPFRIFVNETKQFPQSLGVGDGGEMLLLRAGHGPARGGGGVAVNNTVLHGVPENLADHRAHPAGRFEIVGVLLALQDLDHLWRSDGVHGPGTERGGELSEDPFHLGDGSVRPAVLPLPGNEPFRDLGEGIFGS